MSAVGIPETEEVMPALGLILFEGGNPIGRALPAGASERADEHTRIRAKSQDHDG
jgi:hypothetical protein